MGKLLENYFPSYNFKKYFNIYIMKSLKEYILEKCEDGNCETKPADAAKTFEFNLSGIDNAEETIETLDKLAADKGFEYSTTEYSFSIVVTKEKCDNGDIDEIKDALQQFVKIIRKDAKNSSNESYAQKTKSVEVKFNELIDYIDSVKQDEEE